jgi:AcrR family transcriptional regulator
MRTHRTPAWHDDHAWTCPPSTLALDLLVTRTRNRSHLTIKYTDRYRYFMTDRVPRGQARHQLLKTTAALLAAGGVHAAGVDTIAARTGVTKRTLYQHFPGKDALVAEALADRSTEWHAAFDAAITARADDPAGQLLAMFEVIGQRAAKPDFRGCEFVNAAADLPDRRHPARAVASHHKRALLDLIGQRVAQLGVADLGGLARQLKLLLEGAVATALVDPGPQPARDARAAAATLLAAQGIEKGGADD